jgi:formiminotetrahydrofolate cyclodeaminase
MAFRHASGEGESAVPDYMAGRVEELDELRERLLELVERDAEAYEKLTSAPAPARKETLLACEAPLETAEAALSALRLLAVGAKQVPARVYAECAVALHALTAAVEGGAAVCAANLAGLAEPERAPRAETLAALRRQASEIAREILAGLTARGGTG